MAVTVLILGFVLGITCTGSADIYSERLENAVIPEAPFTGLRVAPADATQLALAMDIPADSLISATIGTSDPNGVGIHTGTLGNHFPVKGETFAILSSGYASSAELPNSSGSLSGYLEGLDNYMVDEFGYEKKNDMVQLTLELAVPEGATCLGFDFVYYSEEYPEFVGTQFNDTFLAEIGESSFVINPDFTVTAPNNFAYDTQGNIISINSVYGMTANSATTYDGGTSVLTAVTPLPQGEDTVTIVLTIQDLGDSVWDSTVFVDNFYWSNDPSCSAGASQDLDGDGLLDEWETNGLDIDGDGVIDLDLPAMGATPDHKDVFVEVDYMMETVCSGGFGFGNCVLHTHQPKKEAIDMVVAAFQNAPVSNPDGTTGIRLHVDAGKDFVMNPDTGALWGDNSRADGLFHDPFLGEGPADAYNWAEFNKLKKDNLDDARKNVFRYCVFAHNLSEDLMGLSGAAQGAPGSGFVVSLGEWEGGVGTVFQQAGAFMRGLGSNMGLGTNALLSGSPTYLSIMNSLFQMKGLIVNDVNGVFDYSRYVMPGLDENHLNENNALSGVISGNDIYGTLFYDGQNSLAATANLNEPLDWNADGSFSDDVAADINGDGQLTEIPQTVNEWAKLVFKGGEVGSLGILYDPPVDTAPDSISLAADELIPDPYAVAVSGPQEVVVEAGYSGTYTLTVENQGEKADTYSLTATTTLGWADISGLPSTLSLDPDQSASFDLTVTIPQDANYGDKDLLTVEFASQAVAALTETVKCKLKVLKPGDTDEDNDVDETDIHGLIGVVLQKKGATGYPDANGDGVINFLDILINLLTASAEI